MGHCDDHARYAGGIDQRLLGQLLLPGRGRVVDRGHVRRLGRHAAYLDYLQRTGRGNHAYRWAARRFFQRWPRPQLWAEQSLQKRLSADSATRPIITFLMLHGPLRPG